MNIIVTGRHIDVTPALKSYAEKKIARVNRYLSNISEANVTISVEKYRHKVETLLKVNGIMIQAEAITGEVWYAGIERNVLLDVFTCRRIARERLIERTGEEMLGRTICGMCIAACPWTMSYLESH